MNFGKCGSSRILNTATVTFSQLRSQKYPSFQAFKLLEVNFHSRASLKYSEWRKTISTHAVTRSPLASSDTQNSPNSLEGQRGTLTKQATFMSQAGQETFLE